MNETLLAWVMAAISYLNVSPNTDIAKSITITSQENPVVYDDVKLTASALIVLGYYEGGLNVNAKRTDDGNTCTTWQVNAGRKRCDILERDVLASAREASWRIKVSIDTCRSLPLNQRLSHYCSGRCYAARDMSRHRWNMIEWVAKKKEFPLIVFPKSE